MFKRKTKMAGLYLFNIYFHNNKTKEEEIMTERYFLLSQHQLGKMKVKRIILHTNPDYFYMKISYFTRLHAFLPTRLTLTN